jgi:hypothetical protein
MRAPGSWGQCAILEKFVMVGVQPTSASPSAKMISGWRQSLRSRSPAYARASPNAPSVRRVGTTGRKFSLNRRNFGAVLGVVAGSSQPIVLT